MKRILGIAATIVLLGSSISTTAQAAGGVVSGKISTFLVGAYEPASKVSANLKANGFQVLTTYSVSGAKSVVFTSPELKKMASKKNRGFAAVLRVLVDKKHKKIMITNPHYFLKAYLQSNYNKSSAQAVLDKLNKAFTSLEDSKDALKKGKISGFHFTIGMPYYEDMDTVAEGDNKALLAKAKASGKMLFKISLSNGSTLVGVKLSKATSKFPSKIGTANASVLPYTVLIEKGKAKTLAPKYNIAIFYPLLSMSQFMTIATVPAAIVSDLEAIFK